MNAGMKYSNSYLQFVRFMLLYSTYLQLYLDYQPKIKGAADE